MTIFRDDDEGFRQWIDAHADGYVLNSRRGNGEKSGPYKLHRAGCGVFRVKGEFGQNFTTTDYYKVCSVDQRELREFVRCHWKLDAVECCEKCTPPRL